MSQCFFVHSMEFNGNQNCLVSNILQNTLSSTDIENQVWNHMMVNFGWTLIAQGYCGDRKGELRFVIGMIRQWDYDSSGHKLSSYFLLATKPLLTRWLDSHCSTLHDGHLILFAGYTFDYMFCGSCAYECVFVSKYKRKLYVSQRSYRLNNSNFFSLEPPGFWRRYSREAS